MAWDGSEYEVGFFYRGPNSTIAANVVGLQAQTGGPASAADVADVIEGDLNANLLAQTSSEVTLDTMRVTRLSDHQTTSRSVGISPASGGQIVPNAALVISFTTDFAGPHGRGRIYLPFVAEVALNDGLIDSTTVDECQVAWAGLFLTLQGEDLQHVILNRSLETVHEVRDYRGHVTAGSQSRRQRRIFV